MPMDMSISKLMFESGQISTQGNLNSLLNTTILSPSGQKYMSLSPEKAYQHYMQSGPTVMRSIRNCIQQGHYECFRYIYTHPKAFLSEAQKRQVAYMVARYGNTDIFRLLDISSSSFLHQLMIWAAKFYQVEFLDTFHVSTGDLPRGPDDDHVDDRCSFQRDIGPFDKDDGYSLMKEQYQTLVDHVLKANAWDDTSQSCSLENDHKNEENDMLRASRIDKAPNDTSFLD